MVDFSRNPTQLFRLGLLLVLFAPSWGSAETPISSHRFTYGGAEVNFLSWQPEPASFTYEDLALPAARVDELRAAGFSHVDRLYQSRIRFRKDGSVDEELILSRIYLNRTGVQDYGNQEIWLDSFGQETRIVEAYSLLPDSRTVSMDPVAIQLAADSEDDIFTDIFRVVLPFGGLEPNAITVLRAQIRHKPSEIGLPWSKIYTPRVFVPREEFEVALVWDQDATVPVWRTDFDGLKCERTGERAARCRASAIQPYPIDPDIDYWDELPSLIVAEPARWEVIASDMNATVTSSLSDGSAAEEKLAELIADASSDREKLDRIHRFVSGDIRYLGLEHGVGGIVPRPAATTLIRKFGDCKDKTTLFIDLARRAGIDAYPVLTSTSRYRASKLLLPAVTYFNHMVSCAVLLNQEEYCVDLTDPYTPYNELPGGLQGAIRLDSRTTPDGPGHFPVMSHRWQKDVNTVNILFADGSMEERQTRVYRGPYATFLRAILRGKTVEERHQWAVNDFQENISKGSKPETDFDGIEDSSESLVVRSTIRYPNFFAVSGGKMEDIESWLAYMGRIFQSANEHHPYDFPGLRYRSTLEYQLAPGVTVQTTGPRLLFESRWGKLRREYKVEVSKVYVETELEMRQQKIPAAELENFNKFLGLAQNYSRVWFSPLTQGDD